MCTSVDSGSRENADDLPITRGEACAMVRRAVSYVRYSLEYDARKEEIDAWDVRRHWSVVSAIVAGCLAGALFTTMMFMLSAGGSLFWRSLLVPSVITTWVFFMAVGSVFYSRRMSTKLQGEFEVWVHEHSDG